MAKTYRKTATIQAIQFDGTNLDEIKKFTKGRIVIKKGWWFRLIRRLRKRSLVGYFIKTLEGLLEFTPGCWIASGGNDDYWAIQDDIFVKTYEEVQ